MLCSDTIRRWYDVPHYIWKLDDPVREANINGSDGHHGASDGGYGDWYLYRLAEAYLLRAEAKFYLNPSDATIKDDINIIRERAHCTQLYGNITIGDIMNERARELFWEEFRNVELTRVSLCLARSGRPDEWGNTYDLATFDKQEGTDLIGGSYWYQRCIRYGMYNKGVTIVIDAAKSQLNYIIDKKIFTGLSLKEKSKLTTREGCGKIMAMTAMIPPFLYGKLGKKPKLIWIKLIS